MTLDRRLNAFRPDLADAALEGVVEAVRYVSAIPARIAVPVAGLRRSPDLQAGIDTEILLGEDVAVFDKADGWAWIQAAADGYVGYIPEAVLTADSPAPTHRVIFPRTFVYPGPDLRFPASATLSMGSRLAVVGEAETRGTLYWLLAGGGAVIANHCLPADQPVASDYVAVAARFLETPYLWGGRSGFGIDCSGLVQLAMMMVGKTAPRDSDMQAQRLGIEIDRDQLRRGDLVFWRGHAGIMEDDETLLHANGHTMTVARENFEAAVKRIGWLYEQPTGYRRPT